MSIMSGSDPRMFPCEEFPVRPETGGYLIKHSVYSFSSQARLTSRRYCG